jgi:DNA (cytosine-5)-methyltransferase 1
VNNRNSNKYKVLSLFSGGMGLDLGLAATGYFETIACIEKIPVFCETIRQNQRKGRLPKTLKVIEADISTLSPEAVQNMIGSRPGEIDVIIGGPPCQSFSTAGKRGTIQDHRGTLLWDFLRFVEYFRPKFFLMENVRGLLSAALRHRPIADRPDKGGAPLSEDEKPGSVVRLFAKDLASIKDGGYHLDIYEVNSVNYGAPQIRERVFFFGNSYNMLVDFPAPTHGPKTTQNADTSQHDLFQDAPVLPWRTLGDVIADLKEENPVILDFSPRKKGYLKLVPPGSNWRSLQEDIRRFQWVRLGMQKVGDLDGGVALPLIFHAQP